MNIEYNFRDAALSSGIDLHGVIIADGKLHRCHIDGHRPGTKNGAFILHSNGIPAGWGMDYKSGISFKWRADGSNARLSVADLSAIKKAQQQRAIERLVEQSAAAVRASELFFNCLPAPQTHPYLVRKRISPHGARVNSLGHLVIALYDIYRNISSVQFIKDNGDKLFLTSGRKTGCFAAIGARSFGGAHDKLLICEGFATGASLFEDTGCQVIIAFDAGNLVHVAKAIRKLSPYAEIIICGDNDISGVGQKAARDAAIVCGGKYMIPTTPGFDWNDQINADNAQKEVA